jgi:hypothetical protein
MQTETRESKSWADKRRQEVAYRAEVVAALGMPVENLSDPYAATTGEMWQWLRADCERDGRETPLPFLIVQHPGHYANGLPKPGKARNA